MQAANRRGLGHVNADPIALKIAKDMGQNLEGVILFGSQPRGDATAESDIDILIVMRRSVRIDRSLYQEWDSWRFPPDVSPHFVQLPDSSRNAHGLWYEVAVDGVVQYDPAGRIAAFLRELRRELAGGIVQRKWSHGHPYWRKKFA